MITSTHGWFSGNLSFKKNGRTNREDRMKNSNSYYSYYYIIALIFGILTAWVISESVGYMLLGAILGLLTAALYLNIFVKNHEEEA